MTLVLASLSLLAGLLPAAIAWVGKRIVDGVVRAADSGQEPEVVHWDDTDLRYELSEEEITALVAFISESTSAGS